jgi:hypothetical protein
VAGLHRLLGASEQLAAAGVVIVVAGMEGALPSVVGGLVAVPVIAVPTSVGYGASFGGLAALLAMLNSCAAGVTVVNIEVAPRQFVILRYQLHETTVQDCLDPGHLPKFERIEDATFLILRAYEPDGPGLIIQDMTRKIAVFMRGGAIEYGGAPDGAVQRLLGLSVDGKAA